jgi:hypothetical protein
MRPDSSPKSFIAAKKAPGGETATMIEGKESCSSSSKKELTL